MNGPIYRLPRPPYVETLFEPPPIIQPRLRDMPPPPGGEVTDWDPVATERMATVDAEELTLAARAAALADDRTGAAISRRRTRILGASQLVDEKGVDEPATVLLAYDYELGRTIEVHLRGSINDLRVETVEESDVQTSASDEEIERAIDLAREHAEEHLTDGWAANALLCSAVSAGDRHFGHRRLVVVFGPEDERLPRVRVLVDLAADEAISVDIRDTLDEEAGG